MDICKGSLQKLSFKCPNLILLSFHSIRLPLWPAEQNCWHSLTELALSFTESPNTFRGIQLHLIMPNIEILKITEDGCPPILLPDVAQCHKLATVELISGGHQSFCFPLKETAPFPSGLTGLKIIMIDFMKGAVRLDTMEVLMAVKKFSTGCKIEYEYFQNLTTICSGTLLSEENASLRMCKEFQ